MNRLACVVAILGASVPAAASPIIGGTADAGDPAVVLIAAYPADESTLFTCTAAVIDKRHLLTVAHCLEHPTGFVYGVFYGADASGSLADIKPQLKVITAVHEDPDYSTSAPFYGDIAIVDLAEDAPVTPLPFARTAPTQAMVGGAVRIVGYGQTTAGTYNAKKFQASTVIASLDTDPDTVTIGDNTRHTCLGDSGGPALLATGSGDVVIGVDSYTDTGGCTTPSHFRRTDAFLPFIDASLAGAGSGSGSGSSTTPGVDAGTGGGHDSGDGGGCSTSGGDTSGIGLALLGLVAVTARRGRAERRA